MRLTYLPTYNGSKYRLFVDEYGWGVVDRNGYIHDIVNGVVEEHFLNHIDTYCF